jgi:hypothetical protein
MTVWLSRAVVRQVVKALLSPARNYLGALASLGAGMM